jgi:predicted aspartyl protease
VLLALAALIPCAGAPGQEPAAVESAETFRFTAKFVSREQHKPVSYEHPSGLAVIRMQLNGREIWALIDNRFSHSVVDEAFARSLGLELTPATGRFFTPSGSLPYWRVTEQVDLAIPGQVGMRAPVTAADLSAVSSLAGRPLALVLGKEYFNVMLFLFMPGSSQVQLGPSGSLRTPADTPYVELADDRPQLEVMIAGRPATLTVDLGYNGEIMLSQHAWTRLGLGALPTSRSLQLDATGGAGTETVQATVGEVSLGPRPVRDVDVTLSAAQLVDSDGYIGFGLLSHFNFALDIKARRLWLIPPFAEDAPIGAGRDAELEDGQRATVR